MRITRDLVFLFASIVPKINAKLTKKQEIENSIRYISLMNRQKGLIDGLRKWEDSELEGGIIDMMRKFILNMSPIFDNYFEIHNIKTASKNEKRKAAIQRKLAEPLWISNFSSFLDTLVTKKSQLNVAMIDDLVIRALKGEFGEDKKELLLNSDNFCYLSLKFAKMIEENVDEVSEDYKKNRISF